MDCRMVKRQTKEGVTELKARGGANMTLVVFLRPVTP